MSILHLAEAKRLGIQTFGMVDTNCDPNKVDFSIPANDDATKSIAIITNYITAAIAEGLAERQASKDDETKLKKATTKTKQKQNVWKPKQMLKVEELSVVRVQVLQLQVHLSVVRLLVLVVQ